MRILLMLAHDVPQYPMISVHAESAFRRRTVGPVMRSDSVLNLAA